MTKIPIEVSARHVHLTADDWQTLFGTSAPTVDHPISQTPQFVAAERLTVSGPKGSLEHVGVVGPLRNYSQMEMALTDARKLGITPPLRESGQLDGAATITLMGPHGQLTLPIGIIQLRHLHVSTAEAASLHLQSGQFVSLEIDTPRGGRMDQVLVRVDPTFSLRLHLDTDEANAFGITAETHATLA